MHTFVLKTTTGDSAGANLMNVYTHKHTYMLQTRQKGHTAQRPQHPTNAHVHTHAHTLAARIHTVCSREGISLVCMRELLRCREKPVFVDYGNGKEMNSKCPCVCDCVRLRVLLLLQTSCGVLTKQFPMNQVPGYTVASWLRARMSAFLVCTVVLANGVHGVCIYVCVWANTYVPGCLHMFLHLFGWMFTLCVAWVMHNGEKCKLCNYQPQSQELELMKFFWGRISILYFMTTLGTHTHTYINVMCTYWSVRGTGLEVKMQFIPKGAVEEK